ncbi:MAG: pyridoxamine 5'-phosphate oxidase family protein [Candidatus Odyssella sp.]|nr:pyridoxamine 5'-phosphate oxidase family protein [Candidatus Odyssella sp.]
MSTSSKRAPLPGWPGDSSPFHAGEQALQSRAGVRERAERAGRRTIRDFMPDEHRELFEKLPYVVLGSLDTGGRPWASILAGRPGFLRTPDATTLEINAWPQAGDPLAANLAPGAPLGVLGIEFETRRRNRMNGIVAETRGGGFAVRVRQSFGNCPQYIQARTARFEASPERAAPAPETEGGSLSAAAEAFVRGADTFFIASASPGARGGSPSEGVDVSHRGGRPGFVRVDRVEGRSVLTAPDFSGNAMFNTLGNLALDPRAGLLFVDFSAGTLLTLIGRTEIVWDGPEVAAFAGAQRLLKFHVEGGVRLGGALPLRWSPPVYAPQLAATGRWA